MATTTQVKPDCFVSHRTFYPRASTKQESSDGRKTAQRRNLSLDYDLTPGTAKKKKKQGRRRTGSIIPERQDAAVSCLGNEPLPRIKRRRKPTVTFQSEEVSIEYSSSPGRKTTAKQSRSLLIPRAENLAGPAPPAAKKYVFSRVGEGSSAAAAARIGRYGCEAGEAENEGVDSGQSRSELSPSTHKPSRGGARQEGGCQWDPVDIPLVPNRAKKGEKERVKSKEMENMEIMLKHMLERHEPVTTKFQEINNYKKGTRDSFNLISMNLGAKVVMQQKERDKYLRSQIQQQKDRYIENVQHKLGQVSINRPLNSQKHHVSNNSSFSTPAPKSKSHIYASCEITRTAKQPLYLDVKRLQDEIAAMAEQKASPAASVRHNNGQTYGHLKAALKKQALAPTIRFKRSQTQTESQVEALVSPTPAPMSPAEPESGVKDQDTLEQQEEEGEEIKSVEPKRFRRSKHNYQVIRDIIREIDGHEKTVEDEIERMHVFVKRFRKPRGTNNNNNK